MNDLIEILECFLVSDIAKLVHTFTQTDFFPYEPRMPEQLVTSSDGKHLLVGERNGLLHIHLVSGETWFTSFPTWVELICLCPDNPNQVILYALDLALYQYDLLSRQMNLLCQMKNEAGCACLAMSLDAQFLLGGFYDGSVRCLSPQTGQVLWQTHPTEGVVFSICVVPDRPSFFIIYGDENGNVLAECDLYTGHKKWTRHFPGFDMRDLTVFQSHLFFTCYQSPKRHTLLGDLDLKSYTFQTCPFRLSNCRGSLSVTPDHKYLVTLGDKNRATFWTMSYPNSLTHLLSVPCLSLKDALLSCSDNDSVWTLCEDGLHRTFIRNFADGYSSS